VVLFLLNDDRYFFEGKMRFVLNTKTVLILTFLVIFLFLSYFMLGLSSYYNYPQKLDRAIRCMLACKNIEEARQNAQSAEAT